MTLPRLFGLPWEAGANGQAGVGLLPAGLMPFIVTGSPLTKQQGQPITVSWVVRNTGGVIGYASLYVGITNGSFLKGVGPVGVLPGSQVTLSAGPIDWLAPGTYLLDVVLAERTSTDLPVRDIVRESAQVTVVSPPSALQALGSPTIS